jgi:subtilase family serine protease
VAAAAEGNGGKGQIVAIVDYSVDPDIAANLASYRSEFGLPACPSGTVSSSNTGCVFEQVAQSGAPSSGSSGWDVEISLDVDTVSAICPNCQILLMEANSASTSALGSAVNTAVADGANAVSNSYGSSEFSGETSQSSSSYYQHPGVAIVASTGDTADEVEFPSVVPDVIAVGGTSLLQSSDQGTRSATATESVWDGTPSASDGSGAGCSAYESAASWQSSFLNSAGGTSICSKRVTADVSADADPDTGLWIYDTYSEGGWLIVGGTSLASPTIAAIYGLAGNATGSSSFPGTTLYANASSLYHVTVGKVGSCGNYLCDATKSIDGYNGPTGLGTPGGAGATAAFAFNPPTPPVIPAQPAPPTIGTVTQTSVGLSWSSVSGATSYNVYSGTSVSSLSLLASGVTADSYTASGLSPSTPYYFALAAKNSAGTSPQSSTSSTTTLALTVPSAPTGLAASAGNGSVSLSWTAPTSNGGSPIQGYLVFYSTTPGGELTGTQKSSSTTSATISSLANGTTYYFQVEAFNAQGDSGASNAANATPSGVAAPGTPRNLRVRTSGSTDSVSWTASSGTGPITYTVLVSTSSSMSAATSHSAGSATNYSVTGLSRSTTYYFEVVAQNSGGSSVPAGPVSARG